jgi:ParB family chromosome partitioning protein
MAMTNRLGRGLGSILDDVEDAYRQDVEEDRSIVKEIRLENIVPNIYQPRKYFDQDALKNLSNSILKHGLLQPIVVVEKDDGYMIIAGERRFRASKLAELSTIDAIVADYESENLRELALIENIQRENLSPLELADSYSELIKEYSITQEELGDIIHKSRSQITNTLRLLTLTDHTKNLLNSSKITQGHAKVLVGLDPKNEKLAVDTIVGQKLSVRESEELVKKMKNIPSSSILVPSVKSENLTQLTDSVKKLNQLGFNAKKSGNSLVISFKSEQEAKDFSKLLIQN